MTREDEEWLRYCYKMWTTSNIQTDAWHYRGNFDGFCRWFLGPAEYARRVGDPIDTGQA